MKSLFFLLLWPGPAAALDWKTSFPEAAAEAKAAGKPLLLDFQAPWCYSCYYMEERVLSGAAFARAAARQVLLKIDVDREEGRALKEKYRVTFLPTYVVLRGEDEAGRIVGEQTEGDFLAKLEALFTAAPGEDPLDAAVASLKKRMAAGDYDQAAREAARIPKDESADLARRKDWKILEARLSLMRAIKAKDAAGLKFLQTLLSLEDSCELAYDADYSFPLVEAAPAKARRRVLEAERRALEGLARRRFFVDKPRRCADFRTGIEVLAEVYEKLGLKGQRKDLLGRAISALEGEGLRVGEDRNLDDNLRVFLDMAGEDARLREHFQSLISAYPTDYVYAYRFARYLEEHKKPDEALPFIEKAARLSYGANRLAVTKIRAKIYAELGNKSEAMAFLARDIKAGRAAFPKEAGELQALLDQLAK